MAKVLTRYFLNKEVRAVWDGEESKWWYSAFDVISILTASANPRVY